MKKLLITLVLLTSAAAFSATTPTAVTPPSAKQTAAQPVATINLYTSPKPPFLSEKVGVVFKSILSGTTQTSESIPAAARSFS